MRCWILLQHPKADPPVFVRCSATCRGLLRALSRTRIQKLKWTLPAAQAQLQVVHDEVVRSLELTPEATGRDSCPWPPS